jgi:hypothetical protein
MHGSQLSISSKVRLQSCFLTTFDQEKNINKALAAAAARPTGAARKQALGKARRKHRLLTAFVSLT